MEYVRCSVGHLLPCISVNVPKTQSWNSCKYIKSLSRVWLFVTPRTVAHQVPLSMGLLQARILEWVDLSFSGDLPNPRIEPRSPALQEDSLPFEPLGRPYGNSPYFLTPVFQIHIYSSCFLQYFNYHDVQYFVSFCLFKHLGTVTFPG